MTKTQGWYLFIHSIPPKPSYLRVKIWRKLQRLGAVPIKNAAYVLPKTDACFESFQWILKEVKVDGGDATLCEASFIEGLTDSAVEGLFTKARNIEYAELQEKVRALKKSIFSKKSIPEEKRNELASELSTLKKKLSEIEAIDFFGSSQREVVQGLIDEIDEKLKASDPTNAKIGEKSVSLDSLKNRVWVTRKGIHVDRIACSWLIQRFIDSKAKFKFVDAKIYTHSSQELRFDMFAAEFTHEGDLCSFEIILKRTHITDPALHEIAEIIHNIDLKDSKYKRDDVTGIDHLIAGICMAHREDEKRLERGSALFDDLYEYFKRKSKR